MSGWPEYPDSGVILVPPQMNEGRRPLDFYETPRWQTEALASRVPISGVVLEPCCGDLAIATVLRELPAVTRVITNDIDPSRPADWHHDATSPEFWSAVTSTAPSIDWVVSNFPFNEAIDILRHAINHVRVGVAVNLRVSFPEPTKERREWLAAHPPDTVGYLPRWSFKRNGKNDSATTAWMLWMVDPCLRIKNFVHPDKPTTPRRRPRRKKKSS